MSLKINILALCAASFSLFSNTLSWNSQISGSTWNYGDNWKEATIPGPTDTAFFDTIPKLPKKQLMVSIIAPTAIGSLEFNNQNTETFYQLFGKVILKMEAPASIVVRETNQNITKVDISLGLTKGLNVFNQGSHLLSLGGKISGKDQTINIYGKGAVEISGDEDNIFSGNLAIHGPQVVLNKKKSLLALPSNATLYSGELITQENTQISKNSLISLIGSTTTAKLIIGSHIENVKDLHIHTSPYRNYVQIDKGGELSVFGNAPNAILLNGNTAINGSGKLIFAGETTGLTFNGDEGTCTINTDIDLKGKNRSFTIQSSSLEIKGKITNGSVTKEGKGTLVMDAENTYSGGTYLQEGILSGTTKTIPGDVEVNGSLHLNQNFDGSPLGTIYGKGTFLKSGSGNLHLTQTNPFLGQTKILGGSIIATTRSLGGKIHNDGILTIGQDFDGILDSTLSGSGKMFKKGSGKVAITSNNPFSGTLFVQDGSIEATTDSFQGTIVNSSTVVIDQDFNGIHKAILDGQGEFIKKGNGAVAINHKNTHKGPFHLLSGSLILGLSDALGNSSLNMSANTALALSPNLKVQNDVTIRDKEKVSFHVPVGSSSIYGNLSGGSFTKTGNGSLGLSGNGNIEGVALESGALEIHGTLKAKNPIVIEKTALLMGTGNIHGNLDVRGTLSGGKIVPEKVPFDMEKTLEYFSFEKPVEEEPSPSDLYLVGDFATKSVSGNVQVRGDVNLTNESTFLVHFNPKSFSQVNVDGTVSLNSPTLQLEPHAGTYKIGKTYTIVTANQIEGAFGEIITPFPMLNPLLSYNAIGSNVSLFFELATHYFSDLFTKGNTAQVACCLDSLNEHPCENSATVISSLVSTSSKAKLKSALEQMQPSQLSSLSVVQENDLLYVRNAIYQRLHNNRKTCNVSPIDEQRPISFWGAFLGGYTTQENQGSDPGYLARSPGISLGVDAEVFDKTTVGGSLSYAYTRHEWKQSRGDANLHNIYASAYGQYSGDVGYVHAALLGGYSIYDVERTITFGPCNSMRATAKSDFGGAEGSFDLKTGLRFPFDTFSVSPFIGLDYMLVHTNSFKESGARSLNLKVKSRLADLFTSEGGIEFDFCQRKETTFLKAFLRFSAIVESRFFGNTLKSSFVCTECAMKTDGFYPTRVLAALGAGVSAAFGRNVFSAAYVAKSQWQFTDQSLYFEYLWKF